MSRWTPDGEPQLVPASNATSWTHPVCNEKGASRTVKVSISGTAMSSTHVPECVARARVDQGRSELERILGSIEWVEPPIEIRFNSDSATPRLTLADGIVILAPPRFAGRN